MCKSGSIPFDSILRWSSFELLTHSYLNPHPMKQHYSIMFLFTLLQVFDPITTQAQCSCADGTAPMTQAYHQSLTTSMETTNFSFSQFDPTLGTLLCTNV